MTFKNIIIIALISFLFGCKENKKEHPKTIVLENTLSIEREQEFVQISEETILAILEKIPNDHVPILFDENDKIITQQWDDIDEDGVWDYLITTLDFKPNEKRRLKLQTISKEQIPVFSRYTDVHFGVGKVKPDVNEVFTYSRQGDPRKIDSLFFQMEGPAWENDKVGFRTYFDPRNGMDIFGKRVADMVLNKTGLHTNYHELEDWGMDILKVGNSLGAGAIAIKYNDTISRVTGVENTEFRLIKEGPIKSTFEVVHKNTRIGNQKMTITSLITIVKGQWGYHREVSFSGLPSTSSLVTGIVNLKPNTVTSREYDAYKTVFSFGPQSENNDNLGMAILTKKDSFLGLEDVSDTDGDIVDTYMLSLKASDKVATSYYFLSGWELSDPEFKIIDGFENMISTTVKRLSNPIMVQ